MHPNPVSYNGGTNTVVSYNIVLCYQITMAVIWEHNTTVFDSILLITIFLYMVGRFQNYTVCYHIIESIITCVSYSVPFSMLYYTICYHIKLVWS